MTPNYDRAMKGWFKLIFSRTCSDDQLKSTVDDLMSTFEMDTNVVLRQFMVVIPGWLRLKTPGSGPERLLIQCIIIVHAYMWQILG